MNAARTLAGLICVGVLALLALPSSQPPSPPLPPAIPDPQQPTPPAAAASPASAGPTAPAVHRARAPGSDLAALPDARAEARGVFRNLDERALPQRIPTDSDRSVYRQRFVATELARFATEPGGATGSLWLNLFDDTWLELVSESIHERAGSDSGVVWQGHVAGDPHSRALFVLDADTLVGNVTLASGELFAIDDFGSGIQRVRELDPHALSDCAVDPRHEHPLAAGAPEAGASGTQPGAPAAPPNAQASGDPIDVMMLYTPSAASIFGSSAALELRLELLIEWANATYADSDATQRLRSVHVQQVSYDDSHADSNLALNDLTDGTGGDLSQVDALRDQFGADMVTLFTGPIDSCGIAWRPDARYVEFYDAYMMSVVNANCIGGPTTYVHELGHNQGAYHDPVTAVSQGMSWAEVDAVPAPNSFGYVEPTFLFHTVMAYASACNYCPRISRFSNPQLTWLGQPTGDARSDVHGTLEATVDKMIAMRATVVPYCSGDADADGVCDGVDNCRDVPNPDQLDVDSDGFGILCDMDVNQDGGVGPPDLFAVRLAFGTGPGDPGYEPALDCDASGGISTPDLMCLRSRYGLAPGP